MRPLLPLVLIPATLIGACADPDVDTDELAPEDGVIVEDGKEDDFLSLSAYEYVVSGKTSITLDTDDVSLDATAKQARVKELIGYKQIATAWFLTQYLVDKEPEDENAKFGGFGGMAKGGAWEDLGVASTDGKTYTFTCKQLIAGGKNLMSVLPLRLGRNGERVFTLEVGKPSNEEMAELVTNEEWYREAPWDGWNPSTVPADKKESLELSIVRETSSTDAWWD